MFDTQRIQEDFAAAAAEYDRHAALQQQVLAQLVRKAAPLLPQQAAVLDAGCGTGMAARMLGGYGVIQLDIAYGMCAKAAGNRKPVVNGTMEALPFADQSFDAVISSLALQWAGNAQKAMREMMRVIKPGGLLAVSRFGEGTLTELAASFAAADDFPHVSSFAADGGEERETRTEYFPDLESLMRHLKSIGARNKLTNRRRSLMTPRQFRAVEDHYTAHFSSARGLRVTWEIRYALIRKP